MIVIEITSLPGFQYRLQVLLGFVESSSSILWLISSHAITCIKSSDLWHSLRVVQHIINQKRLQHLPEKQYPNSKERKNKTKKQQQHDCDLIYCKK